MEPKDLKTGTSSNTADARHSVEETRHPAPVPKRGRAKWVLLAIIVVISAASFWLWRYLSVRESTDDAQIDGHIYPVSARVGGTVLSVHVSDNQTVAAGELLVTLDPRDYQVALDRARAELAAAEAAARAAGAAVPVASITTSSQSSAAQALLRSAEARVTVSVRELDAARARIGPLEARLREAEAILGRAESDFERMKQLIAKDRISQQQFDASRAVADAARAARDAAAAAVAEAEKGTAAAEARLAQARVGVDEARAAVAGARSGPEQVAMVRSQADSAAARVLQARAALERARLDLEYTEIHATVSGVIGMKKVEPGQVLQKEQPILAIVPLEPLWVTANFKETQLANMRIGQSVSISVDAFGGRKYRGHVDSIAAATGARFSLLPPENASGNFVKVVQRIPVKIVLEQGQNPENLLRPGMSVVPTVFTK